MFDEEKSCAFMCISNNFISKLSSADKIVSFRQIVHFFYPSIAIQQETEETDDIEGFSNHCLLFLEKDQDDDFGTDVACMYSHLSRHPLKTNYPFSTLIKTPPYPHQLQAVSWMCSQEGLYVDPEEEERIEKSSKELHPLFIRWPGDPTYYYSPFTHYFTKEFPGTIIHRNGGVICDTMGFGKTYEILALLLTHQYHHGNPERLSIKREYAEKEYKGIDWSYYLNYLFENKECFCTKNNKREEWTIDEAIHPFFRKHVNHFTLDKSNSFVDCVISFLLVL